MSKLKDALRNGREAPAFIYLVTFIKWLFLSLLMGGLGGVIGAAFAHAVAFLTGVRLAHPWLLLLLPVGGLAVAGIYHLCRVRGYSTNTVFEGARAERGVPILLAPAIFIGSAITHFLGGSAGREGAALQLGGSVASGMGDLLRLDKESKRILIMCGMSAVFAAVFGTPLAAAVFSVEVAAVGYFYSAAIFPSLVSAVTAHFISLKLRVVHDHFPVAEVPEFTVLLALKILLIALVAALVSILFCELMHRTAELFQKGIPHPYLREAIGGALIMLFTVLVRSWDYNGSGSALMGRIFAGETAVRPEAFLLKMLFTAVTLGAGFKGGEIVPTLFIGTTLGGLLGAPLGLPVPFAAALGVAALFCGVTNCPMATILLCFELFGGEGLMPYALAAVISFLVSGRFSLYTGQKILFSKIPKQNNP